MAREYPSRQATLFVFVLLVLSVSVSALSKPLDRTLSKTRLLEDQIASRVSTQQRGGGRRCDAGTRQPDDALIEAAKATIRKYLAESTEQPDDNPSIDAPKFYIQGWRWHTMSLIREASQLQKLASRLQHADTKDQDLLDALKTAADYVVDFNMKGLHKIERDLFFPWVRKQAAAKFRQDADDTSTSNDAAMLTAVQVLMDRLDHDRRNIEALGKALNRASSSVTATSQIKQLEIVASKSADIADCAQAMLNLEDAYLVPTIARIVSPNEQKAFNDKVIRNLGILNSRLHLVSMHEAVWSLDKDRHDERALFKSSIPKIPQMMIPRWKRLLYEPRVGVLNKL